MDRHTSNPPPLDRRQSTLSTRSISSFRSNIFGDRHEVADNEDSVSTESVGLESEGGICPTTTRSLSTSPPRPTAANHLLRSSIIRRQSQTPSIAKSPFNTSHDHVSSIISPVPRTSRPLSEFSIARAQSPYEGASGPSQPYAQYSQETALSRNASIASARVPRGIDQASRNQSPNLADPKAAGGRESNMQNPFGDQNQLRGLPSRIGQSESASQNYQRPLHPSGEGADDLIGPHGYREQLPPYTRYPNNIPPKRDSRALSFVSGIVPSRLERQSYAADIEITSTSPATPSRDQADIESHSGEDNPFDDRAHIETESSLCEKEDDTCSFSEKVVKHSKRHVCWGVMPCWVFTIVIFSMIVAVLTGGVIGGLLAKKASKMAKLRPSSTTVDPTSTFTYTEIAPAQTPDEALPALTISKLPSIPTGSFSVKLDNATSTMSSCLTDPMQINAWDCSTGAALDITIKSNLPGQNQSPVIAMTFPQPPSQIRYGAQPPQFTGLTSMSLVEDKSEMSLGPAYTFRAKFNKTVIIRGDDLPGAILSKRSLGDDNIGLSARFDSSGSDSDWTDNLYAAPGDKPWVCHWNSTFLDGFIYVDKPLDSSDTAASSTANLTVDLAAATPTTSPPALTNRRARRDDSNTASRPPPPHAGSRNPAYPRLIKIEERRPSKTQSQPYCQQMLVKAQPQPGPFPYLELIPLYNPDGSANIVNITEIEDDIGAFRNDFIQLMTNSSTVITLPPIPAPSATGASAVNAGLAGSPRRCQCVWANT